ncbi:MAG: hypothetical protein ACK5V3_01345 [Bdellovibrionales bacterium]
MMVMISDSLVDSLLKRWGNVERMEPFLNRTVLWCPTETLEDSALDLERKLLLYKGPLTLVAHGRAGNVVLHALIKSKDLQAKVKKLMLIQAPIWGTTIADFITGHSLMSWVTRAVCYFIRLPIKAVEEMSEFNRQVYMILNRSAISELMQNCEVVTIGTTFQWKVKPTGIIQRLSLYCNKLIFKQSGPNDGCVPECSTKIFNEAHHKIEQVTHLGSIRVLHGSNAQNEKAMILKLSEYPKKFLLVPSEGHIAEEPVPL